MGYIQPVDSKIHMFLVDYTVLILSYIQLENWC